MTKEAHLDISRRLCIVEFSAHYFHLCIEQGFPFPSGTIVSGVRDNEWRRIFEVLVKHESLSEVPEGYPIPFCRLQMSPGEKRGCFVAA